MCTLHVRTLWQMSFPTCAGHCGTLSQSKKCQRFFQKQQFSYSSTRFLVYLSLRSLFEEVVFWRPNYSIFCMTKEWWSDRHFKMSTTPAKSSTKHIFIVKQALQLYIVTSTNTFSCLSFFLFVEGHRRHQESDHLFRHFLICMWR